MEEKCPRKAEESTQPARVIPVKEEEEEEEEEEAEWSGIVLAFQSGRISPSTLILDPKS